MSNYDPYFWGHSPKRIRRASTSNPSSIVLGKLYFTSNGGATWSFVADQKYLPAGRLLASADTCVDQTHPGPPYRTGGPLGVFHYDDTLRFVHTGVYYAWASASWGYKYVGSFVNTCKPADINSTHSNSTISGYANPTGLVNSVGDISSYGATGWKKFRPGNPTADLGVFLGELKDVPRMLQGAARFFHEMWRGMGGHRGFTPRSLADHWLNTQFGWMPFISDVRKFYQTYVTLSDRLERIKRQNGKWVRRAGTVLLDSSSMEVGESNTVGKLAPTLPSYFYTSTSAPGSYNTMLEYNRHVWFEGRFRYYIPDIGTPEWERRAIINLFGLTPCPSLLWELTPWSWLVDWFSNVGDVIANMSTGWAENLAAKYAFVMGTTDYRGICQTTANLKSGVLHDTSTYTVQFKHRVGASPFGFGLTDTDFSIRQWSILSALGLSRLNH